MMDRFYTWLITYNQNAWVSVKRNENGTIVAKDDWYEVIIEEENHWYYVSIGYNDDDWKIYRRICKKDCPSLTNWFLDNYSDWLDDLDNTIMIHSGSHWSYGRD